MYIVWFQAYYGLFIRGKLQPNESVYLNSGTNYTVLAALNILQDSNVKVYVGVENDSQRQYLQKMYPKVRFTIIITLCARTVNFID